MNGMLAFSRVAVLCLWSAAMFAPLRSVFGGFAVDEEAKYLARYDKIVGLLTAALRSLQHAPR